METDVPNRVKNWVCQELKCFPDSDTNTQDLDFIYSRIDIYSRFPYLSKRQNLWMLFSAAGLFIIHIYQTKSKGFTILQFMNSNPSASLLHRLQLEIAWIRNQWRKQGVLSLSGTPHNNLRLGLCQSADRRYGLISQPLKSLLLINRHIPQCRLSSVVKFQF